MKKGNKVHIHIDRYRKIVNDNYALSAHIDEELGIQYVHDKDKAHHFSFKVKDINKFLVAKIKHCI